jgi:hypothetical protein
MKKIKYTCKNCGWETSIWEEWADLKPKRCMNRKCNTSFLLHPDALITTLPEKQYAVLNEERKSYAPKNSKRKESGDSN